MRALPACWRRAPITMRLEVRAELRAHTQALNALRETQLEHQEETRAGFVTVSARITQIAMLIKGTSGAGDD
jgi:hypothetical protein